MKLLLDANLSWRLKKSIKDDFDNVNHILDFFPHNEKDSVIWEFAKTNDFTIITNDLDFLNLLFAKGFPPKIVLLKIGNTSTSNISNILIKHKKEIENLVSDFQLGILEIR